MSAREKAICGKRGTQKCVCLLSTVCHSHKWKCHTGILISSVQLVISFSWRARTWDANASMLHSVMGEKDSEEWEHGFRFKHRCRKHCVRLKLGAVGLNVNMWEKRESLSAEMQLLITAWALIHLSWRQFGRWTLFTAKVVWGVLGGSHQSLGYLEKREPMHRHQFQSPLRDSWYGMPLHNSFFFPVPDFLYLKVKFYRPRGSALLMCFIIIIIIPKNTHSALPSCSLAVWHPVFLISIFN